MEIPTYFHIGTIVVCVLIWGASITFLRLKKKKDFTYLLFFFLFSIYILKVLDYTLFQFQSLILLKHFMPNLMLQGQSAGEEINIIPLITLTREGVKTSLLNILLFIPFGFGLPFITNIRLKKIILIGALFSILIELLQLITGIFTKITFRIADINDVIFNVVGTALGYILFIGFVHFCCSLFQDKKLATNPILRYITERPQKK